MTNDVSSAAANWPAYFDLVIRPQETVGSRDCLAAVWKGIHLLSTRGRVRFAVAFPGWMKGGFTLGDRLRVFVPSLETAHSFSVIASEDPSLADYAEVSTQHRVVVTPDLVYEAYLMRRTPSAISKACPTISATVKEALREKRRRRIFASIAGLPFVVMRSSSGNRFSLTVEKVAAAGSQNGSPNGYGLSRAQNIVALPLLS